MLIQDITKRTGLNRYNELYIEPRRLELVKHMGISKKIKVYEIGEHDIERDGDWSDNQWTSFGYWCWKCHAQGDKPEEISGVCKY